ncbi:transposase [Vibrio sp. SCSIO 43133]|uniref:IS66 family transposase n=1 Tax=Vibrio sp. SCSIO 43133 TaxID=2802577 RepID=UPI002075B73D|nr:IS66 family transposase [Vibrio sp. SCSIO 43133]USE00333.1 transposase [Vibrio sp. SCSIO 43133]
MDKTVLRFFKQGPLGKVVHYTLGQWDKLMGHIDDSRLSIDNNIGERTIRPFMSGYLLKVSVAHVAAAFCIA